MATPLTSTSTSRTRLLAAASLLACTLAASQASAQALVNDPPHTIKTVLGWINQHKQDLRQAQQWRDQLMHYQQQLVSASRLLDRPMTMTMDFQERELDHGMSDQCRSPGGGARSMLSLAALWSSLVPDANGDIKAQQYEICQRIVLARNARFNEQVRMIDNIQQRDGELKSIIVRGLAVGNSQGRLDTVKAELSQFGARATMDLQYSENVLGAYDGLLVSLREDQQRLTRRALRGPGQEGLGSVVQGAALKGALQLARRRDR